MYKIRYLNCNMSSVQSGVNSFAKCRMTTIGTWCSLAWHGFAKSTSLCIEVPTLPQQNSLPSSVICLPLWDDHPGTRYVTTLTIIRTRLTTSTTTLPPQPLRPLFRTTMATLHLHLPLLSFPVVHIRLPHPHLHFVTTKASQRRRHGTTMRLPQFNCNPLTRQQPQVAAILPLHPIRSPLV